MGSLLHDIVTTWESQRNEGLHGWNILQSFIHLLIWYIHIWPSRSTYSPGDSSFATVTSLPVCLYFHMHIPALAQFSSTTCIYVHRRCNCWLCVALYIRGATACSVLLCYILLSPTHSYTCSRNGRQMEVALCLWVGRTAHGSWESCTVAIAG